MPGYSLQRRLESVITQAAATPDSLTGFRGHRGETYTLTAEMVTQLRDAERRIRLLRRDIEQRLAETAPRPCARCRKPVTGRADRKYCSDTCRQAAHQSRHRPKGDGVTVAPSLRQNRSS